MQDPAPLLRKPDWLKVRLPGGESYRRVQSVLKGCGLHTVCKEASCPNLAECFQNGTAAFLILGGICTRDCRYCHVSHGLPAPPDPDEPSRLAEAVKALGLTYCVITSVTRDDLDDGGAECFAACMVAVRTRNPGCRVEVLVPDFKGCERALEKVIAAGPEVINHNLEVVSSLYPALRPQGDYRRSLALLRRVHDGASGGIISKSGFMVGFGESRSGIQVLMEDLAGVRCDRLTIGQYQQPTRNHWPVRKYYHPEEFEALKEAALALGFSRVEAGPLVRSSYRAAEAGIERK